MQRTVGSYRGDKGSRANKIGNAVLNLYPHRKAGVVVYSERFKDAHDASFSRNGTYILSEPSPLALDAFSKTIAYGRGHRDNSATGSLHRLVLHEHGTQLQGRVLIPVDAGSLRKHSANGSHTRHPSASIAFAVGRASKDMTFCNSAGSRCRGPLRR